MPDVTVAAVCTRVQNRPLWYGINPLPDYCHTNGISVVPIAHLEALEYDLLISVLYPFIIEGKHIMRAKRGAFNLHEAPLPRWRGCNGYSHAIMVGDRSYGTTLHVMAPELDAGGVIAVRTFPINPDETAKELYLRTSTHSLDLFKEWLPRIIAGENRPIPQSHVEESFLNGRASLQPYKELTADATFHEVYDRTRALDFLPWQPAYTTLNGGRYYLYLGDSPGRNTDYARACYTVNPSDRIGSLAPNGPGAFRIDGFNRPLIAHDEEGYVSSYEMLT